jgi:hypothetical protein
MSAQYPVHSLRSTLEAERLKLVKKLATDVQAADTVQQLAIVQTALTAVREEIEEHSVQVGGGGERALA